MKPLDEIFSEADCKQIAEWAHGRPVDITGILESVQPSAHNNMCQERLVLNVGEGLLKVIIYTDGDVSYENWSGVRFRMNKPLKVYQLVLERFAGAKKLTKVKVDYGDDDCVWLDLVDQDGKLLTRVEHDHHPDQTLHNVASAICKAAGIEYENEAYE